MSDITLPHANVALQRSLNIQDGLKSAQVKIITEAINKACDRGERSVFIFSNILPVVREHLKSLGYSVSCSIDRNETTYTITW